MTDEPDNVIEYRPPRPMVDVRARTAEIRELIAEAKAAKAAKEAERAKKVTK